MQQFIGEYIDKHQQVLSKLEACAPDIERIAQHCVAAIGRGNKLLLCGKEDPQRMLNIWLQSLLEGLSPTGGRWLR